MAFRRSGGSAPAFRAAQCAQETFNALRVPVVHQELLAVGDTTAKTFQGMTRGNMAEQPVEDHAQPPSGEDIVDKEPASCRSDSSAQDDADAAVSHASPTCLAHASPSNRAPSHQKGLDSSCLRERHLFWGALHGDHNGPAAIHSSLYTGLTTTVRWDCTPCTGAAASPGAAACTQKVWACQSILRHRTAQTPKIAHSTKVLTCWPGWGS